MQIRNLLVLILVVCLACKNKSEKSRQEKFDKIKWAVKKDTEYPNRNNMLNDLIANVTLKGLKKEEVVNLLGEPDRTDNEYLFYNVHKKYLGSFTLHSKTLVIKLTKDSTVEWRKIHE